MKTIIFDPEKSGTDDPRARIEILRKVNMERVQTAWDRHALRMDRAERQQRWKNRLTSIAILVGLFVGLMLFTYIWERIFQ